MKAGIPPPSHGIQRILWVIAVMIGLLSPLYGYAKAGQDIPLAVVVVMDDSSSMRKTDPLKLRFSAFSLLI